MPGVNSLVEMILYAIIAQRNENSELESAFRQNLNARPGVDIDSESFV